MGATRSIVVLCLVLTSCVSQDLQDRRQGARSAAMTITAEVADRAPYRINPGDSLRIEHQFNEELNRVVLVRPDGFINLPLIPEVNVADRTIVEAQQFIQSQYAGTVREPKIFVALEGPSNLVWVGGEVLNPGMFSLADGLTALRAISMAGGPRPSGKMRSVVVLRDLGLPEPQYLLVDLRRTTAELEGWHDLRLRPKDMVFVPRTTIANMNAFVDQYINQLIPFSKNLGVTYLIGKGVY
jgi:protein involved in polysaccharide export with SLBB domain